MKIAFTADNHFDFMRDPEGAAGRLLESARQYGAEVLCVGGDFFNPNSDPEVLGAIRSLISGENTFFVLGNHDLWSVRGDKLAPDDAFDAHLRKYFSGGTPLEASFGRDESTVYVRGFAAFVGSMGFPDFAHPEFTKGLSYYDLNGFTNDIHYMKMSLGWLRHTIPMQSAFAVRLEKAVALPVRDIVVVTHYCILDEQRQASGDGIAAYFFNHFMGQRVLSVAKENPGKRFWCLAGHSHEFCAGSLTMASENVFAMGLSTDYRSQHVYLFDTDSEINQDRCAVSV
jgi:hypothetical protein